MNIFQEIEHLAVVAWDDFLGGIKWLSAEATALKNAVEKADPAIQAQVQALIKDAEAAAEQLAGAAGGALGTLLQNGTADAETAALNLISHAANGNPLGTALSALTTDGLSNLSQLIGAMGKVGFTKALAGIQGAAQSGVQSAGG